MAWTQHSKFHTTIKASPPHVEFVPHFQLLHAFTVDMVMGDSDSLDMTFGHPRYCYWGSPTVPYFLSETPGSQLLAPPHGWSLHSDSFLHAKLRGSTYGQHCLTLLILSSNSLQQWPFVECPVQPWISMEACLNPVSSALPAAKPMPPQTQEPVVCWNQTEVWPYDLLPTARFCTKVRVWCIYNKDTH